MQTLFPYSFLHDDELKTNKKPREYYLGGFQNAVPASARTATMQKPLKIRHFRLSVDSAVYWIQLHICRKRLRTRSP